MPPSPALHIVRASAGSGKTHALTERLVGLLLGSEHDRATALCGTALRQGYAPCEVLAVTFTNAAAEEMRGRVVMRLKSAALSADDPGQSRKARRLLGQVLRHFQDLNIRTIESLLSRLVRLFALELGLAPDFEVSFDSRPFFDELYDGLCARIPDDNGLRSLFEEAFTRRLLWLDKGSFMPGSVLRESMAKVFDAVLTAGVDPRPVDELDQALEVVRREVRETAARLDNDMAALGIKAEANLKGFLEKLKNPEYFDLSILKSAMARKTCLRGCFRANSKCAGLLDAHQARLDPLYLSLIRALTLAADLFRACCLAPQARLAALLREPFAEMCRQRGLSLSKLWPRALTEQLQGDGGVPDAFCRLGSRLEHILVDEFQDTSRDQWQVLLPLAQEPLSRGGSLYLVGDPKQAIYGWRGGDAALMVEAGRAFASVPVPALDRLEHNWRSRKAVIDFNNRVFSLLEDDDGAQAVLEVLLPEKCSENDARAAKAALLESFSGSSQGFPSHKDGSGGCVRIVRVEAADKDEYAPAALNALVADILAAAERGTPLRSMAVLTRTNEQSEDIAARLLAQGVPTITENSLRLAGHPRIEAIMALLSFLDYPADDTAFFGFVSSDELFGSASGLSAAELRDWLCACKRGRPVYLAFQERYPQAYQDIVAPFFVRAGLCSPYDLVAEIIECFELRTRFPGDDPFLDRLLELAHEAGRRSASSLSDLLELWRDKGAQERLPKPEGAQAVSVMTAHRAKGLQFPLVFHPLLRASRDRGELLEDLAMPLCLSGRPPGPGQGALSPQVASRLEELNLLYVAWTRAEDELSVYLPREDGDLLGKRGLAKAVDLLLKGLADDGLCSLVPYRDAGDPASLVPPAARTAPGLARSLPLPRPLHWLPGLRLRKTDFAPLSALSEADQAKARGTLLHRAAELMLRARGALGAQGALAAALTEKGPGFAQELSADQRAVMADNLAWLFDSQPVKDLLADTGVSILPEADLIMAKGELIRPDVVFVGPHIVLCLDFKTGRAHPEHHEQLARYVRELEGLRLAGLFPASEQARGLLAYLDARRLTPVNGDPE